MRASCISSSMRCPHAREHVVSARRELPLGALLCGTDLATCYRGAASLFYHCPYTVQTLPVLPYVSARASLRGHYSWDTLDLMTHRLEGLIFPSLLLANRSPRVTVQPSLCVLPNVVLHFLGNGLSCGEVIRPITIGEALIRHWDLGDCQWRHTERTRWWSYNDGASQARIRYDLLKPSDDYYLDCLSHDADYTRADRTLWYCEATFTCQALLAENCNADLVEQRRASKERYQVEQQASERSFLQLCDVNALL